REICAILEGVDAQRIAGPGNSRFRGAIDVVPETGITGFGTLADNARERAGAAAITRQRDAGAAQRGRSPGPYLGHPAWPEQIGGEIALKGPVASGNGKIRRHRPPATGAILHIGGLAEELGKHGPEAFAQGHDLRPEFDDVAVVVIVPK